MTTNNLTQNIKQFAYNIGFSKIGITPAGHLDDESERLRQWLDRGFQGTMKWMETKFEKRADPKNVLADAKSVISVALNYYTPSKHGDDPTIGKISRYAWGDDYHDVLTPLLEKLLAHIKTLDPSASGKAYVDTGPVMDKVWAQ